MNLLKNLSAEQLSTELASEKNIGNYVTVCTVATKKEMSKVYKVLDILYKNRNLGTSDGDFIFNNSGLQIKANEN